jgi:uncharacterized phage infection (PIP) family protein YhgE
MTTEQAIDQIHKQLERQNKKLETIQQTLQKIAVQEEQIRQIQSEQQALWLKMDALTATDGTITQILNYQASCPRHQIKYLWLVVIPMGLTQLTVSVKLIAGIF